MIDKLGPLFYGDKLNTLEWSLLRKIHQRGDGHFLLSRNYPDLVGEAIHTLKNLRFICGPELIGELEPGKWKFGYSCTEAGHEVIRLLSDPERVQVFPAWGKAAKAGATI
jgi:hypothetical protein